MKFLKTFSLVLALILPMITNAQTKKEAKKNEIGTDITSLIEQIFNFNQAESFTPYSATYQITYKRHFKKFSTRIGIGGATSAEDVDSDSEEVYKKTNQKMNYRLGIEKSIGLNKRWNFYYGIDFKHSIVNFRNDLIFKNGGWGQGSDRKSSVIGFSPLFGVEFKISKRIALQTEANFIAYFSNTTNQPIVTQVSDNPSSDMPSTELEKNKIRGTAFNAPNFIVLTIKL